MNQKMEKNQKSADTKTRTLSKSAETAEIEKGSMNLEKIFITDKRGQRRLIGYIRDRVFRKKVKGSIHLFKKLDAWGIDAEVFKKKLINEVDEIRVLDEEEGVVYQVGILMFDTHGKYLHFPPHRAQIFLPKDKWTTYKN